MVLSSDLWVKESGNVKGREKLICQCMPLFFAIFPSTLHFYSSLPLSFLTLLLGSFSFLFSVFFLLSPYVPSVPIHGYLFSFYTT